MGKEENRSERPPQQRARCQSPPQVGFRDTHRCMYRAPPISRGIKNTLAESREEREEERQ